LKATAHTFERALTRYTLHFSSGKSSARMAEVSDVGGDSCDAKEIEMSRMLFVWQPITAARDLSGRPAGWKTRLQSRLPAPRERLSNSSTSCHQFAEEPACRLVGR
jgi:hypothetical protein